MIDELIHAIQVLEQWIERNCQCMILVVTSASWLVAAYRPESEWDSKPDLCDAGAMLHQLSYHGKLGADRYEGSMISPYMMDIC